MTRDEAEPGVVRVGPFWDGVEGRAGGRRVWYLVEYFGITAHAISIEVR